MSDREISDLREHLERYRGVTLQALEWTPVEKLDWRPMGGRRSFAEHFVHIARTESYHARGLMGGDWDFDRWYRAPAPPSTHEGIRAVLDGTRAYTLDRLDALDPGRLDGPVVVPDVPVSWTLRAWLWYLVEHEVHHKSQIAFYLRMNGIVPPFFALAFPRGVRPDLPG
jgi:uncharacterized damage-inducible protein DinB